MAVKENLFADFPPVSTQDWIDKITVDLKGADFEKRLVWKTTEGFKMKPFYRKEDVDGLATMNALPGEFPYLRGTKKGNNAWFVRQDIVVDAPKEANTKALELLNKGIDSLGFTIKADQLNADFVALLLEGICVDCVELNFTTCQRHTLELAQLLADYFEKKGYETPKIKGSINFDPYEVILKKGIEAPDFVAQAAPMAQLFAAYPYFKVVMVNAKTLCNAGAYIYQELGYALAWGNAYLGALIEAGVPAALAAKKIRFSMGISSNYFMELAKFRAARLLWSQIVSAYKPECPRKGICSNTAEDGECRCAAKMYIHAETSHFNLTMYDAHVNLLRTQTEAMSAALAGVDSMTVTPFDAAYKESDELSERFARNQQLLLKEESHFDKVIDPAAGSYYIENLTTSIAQQAWKLFLEVEAAGGFFAALQQNTVQEAVNASNLARHGAISSRREVLLGSNQFPNFTEQAGEKQPLQSFSGCEHSHDTKYQVLNTDRAASEFEKLRLETEQSRKKPIAFMLTIGNLTMRQARAQYSCNFLGCAGYQVIDNLGFPTIEEGIDAAMNAKADIVVICSSDDEYAEYAIPAFKALAGRALFVVAGNPACTEELKAAGIEHFVHVRANVLDTLRELNKKLGIK